MVMIEVEIGGMVLKWRHYWRPVWIVSDTATADPAIIIVKLEH